MPNDFFSLVFWALGLSISVRKIEVYVLAWRMGKVLGRFVPGSR